MIQMRDNILGTEKIGPLLAKFAIPSIIAMVVSSLYNIVDQFFIGQSVGVLGNAATNVAYPMTIVCLSISLLCGIGGAANFNLSLGRKQTEQAEHFAGGAISMMFLLGVILCIVVQIFLEPIMIAFGATDAVMDYAMTYTRITAWGFPFLIATTGGSNLVRADGSPKYSMLCTLAGAVANTILDPIFIFGMNMGIAGAAYATVIGQVISATMVVVYLTRFKTIHIHLNALKPRKSSWIPILTLGMAPFFNQVSMMIVQVILNNSLRFYGERSIYGSEVTLACAGIIIKVNMVFFSMVIGIAQGIQPIISYNFGAEKYDRVKDTFKKASNSAILISTVAFLLFQFFPRQIIGLFGKGNELYFLFAEKFFRIYLFFTFINGIQPIVANTFTAIGKAKTGLFVSLTRQIIFLIPLLLILPVFMGIDGVMFSAPIADGIAALVSIILIYVEFKKMRVN